MFPTFCEFSPTHLQCICFAWLSAWITHGQFQQFHSCRFCLEDFSQDDLAHFAICKMQQGLGESFFAFLMSALCANPCASKMKTRFWFEKGFFICTFSDFLRFCSFCHCYRYMHWRDAAFFGSAIAHTSNAHEQVLCYAEAAHKTALKKY